MVNMPSRIDLAEGEGKTVELKHTFDWKPYTLETMKLEHSNDIIGFSGLDAFRNTDCIVDTLIIPTSLITIFMDSYSVENNKPIIKLNKALAPYKLAIALQTGNLDFIQNINRF